MTYAMSGRRRFVFSFSTLFAAALACGGCSTTPLGACMAYELQPVQRTVSMRGYGYLDFTKEQLVCTQRSEVLVASIAIPEE